MRSRHLLQGWPNEIWHVGVYAAVEAFRTSAMDDALRIGIVALGARARILVLGIFVVLVRGAASVRQTQCDPFLHNNHRDL